MLTISNSHQLITTTHLQTLNHKERKEKPATMALSRFNPFFMPPTFDDDDDMFMFPLTLATSRRAMEPYHPRPANNLMKQLSTNVKETKDSYVYQIPVDEYKPEDVEIKVEKNSNGGGHVVKLSGKHSVKDEEKGFYSSSSFTRQFTLGDNVDVNKMSANYSNNGTLEVTVPKKKEEEKKPASHMIPITFTEPKETKDEKMASE